MKTTIFSIISIIIFLIITSGSPNQADNRHTVLIQAADKNITLPMLSASVEIISSRLKDFSSEKFDIETLPEKNQIQVVLTGSWNLKAAESLIADKGVLEFYETWDFKSLVKLLNSDNSILSVLKSKYADSSRAEIGCTPVAELENITLRLNSRNIAGKCRFAWTQDFDSPDVCLFALKPDGQKGAIISGNDIDNVKFINDKLEIKLKKSATEVWSEATRRNVKNVIALVLDNHVISAPRVMSAIDSGEIEITGKFTQSEGRYTAAILNNGELPLHFMLLK
jgi:preprotein translocase subunit SecD